MIISQFDPLLHPISSIHAPGGKRHINSTVSKFTSHKGHYENEDKKFFRIPELMPFPVWATGRSSLHRNSHFMLIFQTFYQNAKMLQKNNMFGVVDY